MPGESFRFIHASDFHLERPLGDLDSLPAHLREPLADAPWRAAHAVFEAALVDNVNFLVLSGDLLSPQAAGPHGMAMLLDHFEQLEARNTAVFWAAGLADDPQKWPEAVPLPSNVTLFPKSKTVTIPVERGGRTICSVVGRSCDGRSAVHVPSYRIEPNDDYTIGIGYGTADVDALSEARFDYWALGGVHDRTEMEGGAEAGAVYCGTPQGRCLSETGAHGYSIVDVDSDRNTRIHPVECDSFRYCRVEIDAAEIAAVGGIRNLLGERIIRLQHENGGRHLLIGWDISVATGEALHAVGDANELLQWLRREYGHGTPAAWSLQVNVRPPRNYPKSWHDEDTILGDYLRVAEKNRKTEARDLNLLPFTEERGELSSTTTNLLAEAPAASRVEILDQATLLGVELLRGGKPNLVRKS